MVLELQTKVSTPASVNGVGWIIIFLKLNLNKSKSALVLLNPFENKVNSELIAFNWSDNPEPSSPKIFIKDELHNKKYRRIN